MGRENSICEQNYYKRQQRPFEMTQAQQDILFADATPVRSFACGNVTVTVRIAGTDVDIQFGADATTLETVLCILKSC